jgi:transporter family protein
MVFILVWVNAFALNNVTKLKLLTQKDILFLCLSGATTTLSWVFYYRAMKEGSVSVVATIDKASIVITLLLSFFILKEPFTWQIGLAGSLITAGLLILIYK